MHVRVAVPDQAGEEDGVLWVRAEQADVPGLLLRHREYEVVEDQIVDRGRDEGRLGVDGFVASLPILAVFRGEGQVATNSWQPPGLQAGQLLPGIGCSELRDVERVRDRRELRLLLLGSFGGGEEQVIVDELAEARIRLVEHDHRSRRCSVLRVLRVTQEVQELLEHHRIRQDRGFKRALILEFLFPHPSALVERLDELGMIESRRAAADHLDARLSGAGFFHQRTRPSECQPEGSGRTREVRADHPNPVALRLESRTIANNLDGLVEGSLMDAGRRRFPNQQKGQ